jgi:transketolase
MDISASPSPAGHLASTASIRPRPSAEMLSAKALALRASVIAMIKRVRVGYLLQGLGAADIFATLFFSELRLRPDDPEWDDRDRFLLSTAHNTALLYATLAHAGYFPLEDLETYTKDGSALEVNASERMGRMVEATCGSLGQGLSVAVGMAMALRRRGSGARVYVVLGDGELQEGQVWEAALSAGHFGLDNLCMIIDRNFLQVEGHTDKVLHLDPIPAKFSAFGWHAEEIDGNDRNALVDVFARARAAKHKPYLISAVTKPGAGIPFFEGQMSHVALLSHEDADRAQAYLQGLSR